MCKRNLVYFLTEYLLQNISNYIKNSQIFMIAGGFREDIQDTAWLVTGNNTPKPNPQYTSNAEESDMRIWLHVKMSEKNRILIRSPDTDVYHIGLTCTEKDVIVQINPYSTKQLQFLHLLNFKLALKMIPIFQFSLLNYSLTSFRHCMLQPVAITYHFFVE